MRYDENPTWRMLENSKNKLKEIADSAPPFDPNKHIIVEAYRAIARLQLALENKLSMEQ